MMRVSISHQTGPTLDVDFECPTGVTAIFGPSGAGKTTLLRAIGGLFRPDTAHITLGDKVFQDAAQFLKPQARNIGYVFQDARLFPHLTVAQNLQFAARFGRAGPGFEHLVETCGLGPLLGARPAHLSGGEAQRVAIARALLSAPDLVVMDEPMAGLDAARRAAILPVLEALRDTAQVPVLYVSHNIAEVARLANHIVLLRDGVQRQAGPLEQVLADPSAVQDLGLRDAGAVVQVTHLGHDGGLSTLALGDQQIVVPQVGIPVGSKMRLRVAAHDIILSLKRPDGISAINILLGQITSVQSRDQTSQGHGVSIGLDVGGARLVATITKASAQRLGLKQGMAIHVILKATAFDPDAMGP